MAIDFSKLFERLTGSSPAKERNDTQQKKTESTGLVKGWPFVHFGEDRYKPENYLVLPRPKYTWFAEFDINEEYLKSQRMVTNLDRFLKDDRRLYLNLKRIDHPKPNIPTETLRSYNKYVKVQTKVEYPPAQMTFDDDATSIIVALWKEYFAFYSHTGDVGFEKLLQNNNLVSAEEDDNFAIDKNIGAHGYGHLVSVNGTEPRNSMDIRGSMGMRLKPNAHRHFFERIVIYDLGTEPDSVNVYYYYRPVITAFDHSELDWEDRTGKVEVNVTFEYENYYFALGIPRLYVKDVIEKMTGQKVEGSFRESSSGVSTTHGDMITPEFASIPETAKTTPDTPTPVFSNPSPPVNEPSEGPPTPPSILEQQRQKIIREHQRLLSEFCSSTRDTDKCRKIDQEFETEITEIERQINDSRTYYSREESLRRSDKDTQEARQNTEEAAGIQKIDPSSTAAVRTAAQEQGLRQDLERLQGNKLKLQNTSNTLFNQQLALRQSLSASDNGELPGPNNTYSPQQREKVVAQIESLEAQLNTTLEQINRVAILEEQIIRALER